MTCAEEFNVILKYSIPVILDYIEGWMAVVSVLLMMIHLFGSDGRITRRKLIPITVFICVGTGFYLFCLGYDYMQLKPMWNEPVPADFFAWTRNRAVTTFGKVLFFSSIILTAAKVFYKNKVRNSIAAVIMTVFLLEYLMIMQINAISYFWGDPRETVERMKNMMSLNGRNIEMAYVCELSLAFILSVVLAALYFGMVKRQRKIYIGWKYRIAFIIWEAVMMVVHQMPLQKDISDLEHQKYMGYELGIFIPMMGLVIPFIFVAVISRRYMVEKTKIQESYISAELDYLNQYKKDQNETRAFRHDIINNLALLSTMYSEKNYEDAGAHLKTLLGNIKKISPRFVTGNEMLDCIVGMKASKIDEEGIDFSVEGSFDSGIEIKPIDICTIFSNALDNAIEACSKLTDESEKWIKLSMKKSDEFFSVKLENTMPVTDNTENTSKLTSEDENLKLLKKEKKRLSYGTQNIKDVISKYEGAEKVDVNNGVFSLSITIPRTA